MDPKTIKLMRVLYIGALVVTNLLVGYRIFYMNYEGITGFTFLSMLVPIYLVMLFDITLRIILKDF